MNKFECGFDRKFAELTKCEIGVKGEKTGVNFSGMYTTNITSLVLEMLLFTKRKSQMKLLMKISDIDCCNILNGGRTPFPLIQLFKDLLDSGGNLPKKCPISSGHKIDFKDMNANPQFFPFLPDMKFLIIFNFALNDVPRNVVMNVTGEIFSLRKPRLSGR